MAAIFKATQPEEYFKAFREFGTRHDDRKSDQFRKTSLNIGALSKCNGSSVVKCGGTSVTCGIKAELSSPKDEMPGHGYLVIKVDIPESAGTQFSAATNPNLASDKAQVITELLIRIMDSSKSIKTEDLCIKENKVCWCLYCDIICLSYDGNLLDAALISLISALRNTRYPTVSYNEELGLPEVDRDVMVAPPVYNSPVSTTFTLYDKGVVYVDGDMLEEEMSSGHMTFAYMDLDKLCLVHKPGGRSVSHQQTQSCMKVARQRYEQIAKLITDQCHPK